LRPDERDLPYLAVAFSHFDRPALPTGDVVLFQIMDDLQGLFARRLIIGEKLRRFLVIEPVAVVERELIEGHGP
jgi:hypothetical protein